MEVGFAAEARLRWFGFGFGIVVSAGELGDRWVGGYVGR